MDTALAMSTPPVQRQASVQKRNGSVGYCLSFVFSQFHTLSDLQELNKSASEIKKDLDRINQDGVRFQEPTKDNVKICLDLLDRIRENALPNPKQVDLTDGSEESEDVQRNLIKTLEDLKHIKSWTFLASALESCNRHSQENSAEDSPQDMLPSGVSHEVVENNGLSFCMNDVIDIEKRILKFSKRLLNYRKGAVIDTANIQKTFQELSFDSRAHTDADKILTEKDMQDKLNSYLNGELEAGEEKHKFFVLVISSHGGWNEDKEQSYICLPDGKSFTVTDIYDILEKSPILTEIPKIIFIQACQGEMPDVGKDAIDTRSTNIPQGEVPSEKTPKVTKIIVLPSHSNFIIHYSTVQRHVAWSNELNGSYFIATLCKHLLKKVKKTQFHTILLEVNKAISKKTFQVGDGYNYKQMPYLVTTSLGDFHLVKDKARRGLFRRD